MKKYTQEEKEIVYQALQEGHSFAQASRAAGRSRRLAYVVSKERGLSVDGWRGHALAQRLSRAQREYDKAHRLELLNALFDLVWDHAEKLETVDQLQKLVTTVAVLIDKRRLEEGEATQRTEDRLQVLIQGAAEDLDRQINLVLARRQAVQDVAREQGYLLPSLRDAADD